MKKLFASLLAVCALALSGYSQVLNTNTTPPTLEGPGLELIQFLSQGSNWIVAPYGIYDDGSKQFGAGIGAFYEVSSFFLVGMRLDGLGNDTGWELWMPSGQVQLQAPFMLFGKVKVTPFGFGGIATPLSGQGDENGTPVGIFGAGLAVGVYKNLHLVADVEEWVGANFSGEQYRFGLAIHF
jgi:hypothetical protein